MNYQRRILDTPEEVAIDFAQRLVDKAIAATKNSPVFVCLSGGSTPKRMFQLLSDRHSEVDWEGVHFFWGDERCVAPDDEQSNFGEADRLFLSNAKIPASNVHRVLGELDPEQASRQYSAEIQLHVPKDQNDVPCFDLMILGMGDDGHTASIFPHEMQWLESDRTCEVATHPTSGQNRVTVTGRIIRAAKATCFLITGKAKSDVLATIFKQEDGYLEFPTSHLLNEQVTFYLDAAAASQL